MLNKITDTLPVPEVSKEGNDVFVARLENNMAVINYITDDDGNTLVQISTIIQGIDPKDNIRDRRYTQQILFPQGILCLYDALKAFTHENRFFEEYKKQFEQEKEYQEKMKSEQGR